MNQRQMFAERGSVVEVGDTTEQDGVSYVTLALEGRLVAFLGGGERARLTPDEAEEVSEWLQERALEARVRNLERGLG